MNQIPKGSPNELEIQSMTIDDLKVIFDVQYLHFIACQTTTTTQKRNPRLTETHVDSETKNHRLETLDDSEARNVVAGYFLFPGFRKWRFGIFSTRGTDHRHTQKSSDRQPNVSLHSFTVNQGAPRLYVSTIP